MRYSNIFNFEEATAFLHWLYKKQGIWAKPLQDGVSLTLRRQWVINSAGGWVVSSGRERRRLKKFCNSPPSLPYRQRIALKVRHRLAGEL